MTKKKALPETNRSSGSLAVREKSLSFGGETEPWMTSGFVFSSPRPMSESLAESSELSDLSSSCSLSRKEETSPVVNRLFLGSLIEGTSQDRNTSAD